AASPWKLSSTTCASSRMTRKILDSPCSGNCRRYYRMGLGNSMTAIVLVSGGMDSCVTAAIANSENQELAFLHVSYGQRTEKRERKAFNDIADFYAVDKRLDVSIEHLAKIGGSSLTDKDI